MWDFKNKVEPRAGPKTIHTKMHAKPKNVIGRQGGDRALFGDRAATGRRDRAATGRRARKGA